MFLRFTAGISLSLELSNKIFFLFIIYFYCHPGVEFGARMINIEGKQIKLQIWDTVSKAVNLCCRHYTWYSLRSQQPSYFSIFPVILPLLNTLVK